MKPTGTLLRRAGLVLGALLFLVALSTGASCERNSSTPSVSETPKDQDNSEGPYEKEVEQAELLEPKDVGPPGSAIFMMTGLKGYTEPCGCTLDIMLGGIDRIVRYFDDARPLYENSVVVDGGNLFFENANPGEHEIPQEKARVDVIVEAVKRIAPLFTVPGNLDFALGTNFYLDAVERARLDVLAANLSVGERSFPGHMAHMLGDQRVHFIGVVDPTLFENIDGVATTDPRIAIESQLKEIELKSPDTVVLVAQGDLAFVKAMLQDFDALDFGLVGNEPRETDQVDDVEGRAFTLEPYDQGRYIGILKLYPAPNDKPFVNAREGSKAEVEKVQRQIEHVDSQIDRLPPATPGNESGMLARLRERLDSLKSRQAELRNASIVMPEDASAFIWRSVPMEPGFPTDDAMERVRKDYNRSLKALNSEIDRDVIPPEEGEPFYVGNQECAMCHAPAMDFWKETAHAKAVKTLEDRDKLFDQTCIGCHVVGYDKPGGSVMGKLEYSVEHQPNPDSAPVTIDKDLKNVGCESCHGPGSMHRFAPVDSQGKPQHIRSGTGENTCLECHVPEHSPRFNYEVYVREITGEGHELRSP